MNAVFRSESPRLAQDFSAPAYCGSDARSAIVHDLATRIIEEDHDKNRVSVVNLHALNNSLIDNSRPNSGDVGRQFVDNDVETVAAGNMFARILERPGKICTVWISPPGGQHNYEEGRLIIAFGQSGQITEYVLRTDYSPEENLYMAQLLSGFAEENLCPKTAEGLRSAVFTLPLDQQNPDRIWCTLEAIFPHPGWEKITSGKAEKEMAKLAKQMEPVVEKILSLQRQAVTAVDYLRVGAMAEQLVRSMGYAIGGGGCGISNSAALTQLFFTRAEISPGGGIISVEGSKYIRNCGNCGATLERFMSKGDRCPHCSGVYEGC